MAKGMPPRHEVKHQLQYSVIERESDQMENHDIIHTYRKIWMRRRVARQPTVFQTVPPSYKRSGICYVSITFR